VTHAVESTRSPRQAEPLLTIKLYVPRVRRDLVPRARLVQRLDEGVTRKLALVSAPAGYGKTTLLAEWAAATEYPVAWLSLDREDDDPGRFWTYLIAALRQVEPSLSRGILQTLRSLQGPPPPALLATLINQVDALANERRSDGDLVLVLDDYHLVTSRSVHDGLAFLLDHVPPQLHLVIASRTDPPLPLHLLRARGQLTELRAADLRFTSDEAAAFLKEAMGLRLSAEHVAALERRTEGWITGLQLAALSMEGRDDVSRFVQAFTGSHRYLLDYLVEEVLQRQPQAVQTFLLRTSILERLIAPLCDAVTGREDGFKTLEALEQANLFIVPLDDERRWYRYHHLFAEVLRALLQRTVGKEGLVPLHTRAAEWYEEQGEVNEAFRHAAAAEDFERAARLIEENWLHVGHAGRMNTILRWLETMPEDVVRARPVLSLAYAWALWLTGQMDAAEPYMDAASEALDRQEAAGVSDPGRARWRAGIVALRLQLARHRGQLEKAIEFADQTLALAPPGDALVRGYGHLGHAHAYRELGDYGRSLSAYAEATSLMRTARNFSSANLAAFYRCRVLQHRGHLREAHQVVQEALQFARIQGVDRSPASGILHVAMGSLSCEWNELSEAEDHLRRGLEMSRLGGHHDFLRNAAILMARPRLAQRDPTGALELIREAEQAMPQAEMPLPSAELAAHKARAWIAQGNLSAAARWAAAAAGRPGLDRGHTRQTETLTRARVLAAQGDLEQALAQLTVCQRAAEESGAHGTAIEIAIVSAMVRKAEGDRAGALDDLGRALVRAEPEGYVQVFVDEGPPMAALLSELLRVRQRGAPAEAPTGTPTPSPDYVRRLLDALDRQVVEDGAAARAGPSPLVEPLTPRETEVLQLMAAGLSNREIAEALIVAVGTVKAHLHHIYGKLAVRSRTEAAARARELDLL
jgi:LuxR family maltose regulon positive regulatory protein